MVKTLLAAAGALALAATATIVARTAEQSCDDLLSVPREVRGHRVGPASCLLQDAQVTYDGHAYQRVDIGLDGSVDGFAAKVGDYKDYFTNGPDLIFPQTWGPRQIFFGVAKYERAKGA
ncbi:MAG TPA: hypothetical protein VH138_15620 [Vicinamibacterales bacterium]|nr:hypothetical protein [Vicinamibacterales bacterium]